MADTRRITAAPRSAVLYVYDPERTAPTPVSPASNSLVVVLPSDALDLETYRQFFVDAAVAMGLDSAAVRDLS